MIFEDEMTDDMICASDADYSKIMRRERHDAAIDEARAQANALRGIAALMRMSPVLEGDRHNG
jgi:hypothetical protein